MIKKQKKQSRYIFRNKEFTTFKEMKTYAYFNMSVGTKEEALDIIEDEIIKKYELIKQERRLLCTKTYDAIEKYKKRIEKLQLELFKDGQKKDHLRDYQNHLYGNYQYCGSSNSAKLYNVTKRKQE